MLHLTIFEQGEKILEQEKEGAKSSTSEPYAEGLLSKQTKQNQRLQEISDRPNNAAVMN